MNAGDTLAVDSREGILRDDATPTYQDGAGAKDHQEHNDHAPMRRGGDRRAENRTGCSSAGCPRPVSNAVEETAVNKQQILADAIPDAARLRLGLRRKPERQLNTAVLADAGNRDDHLRLGVARLQLFNTGDEVAVPRWYDRIRNATSKIDDPRHIDEVDLNRRYALLPVVEDFNLAGTTRRRVQTAHLGEGKLRKHKDLRQTFHHWRGPGLG